ncbi:MAG: hypothetical protein WAS51_08735 [Ilumatobacteraceae bacterium]
MNDLAPRPNSTEGPATRPSRVPTSNEGVHRNGPCVADSLSRQIAGNDELTDTLGRHPQDARRIRK